MSEYTFHITVYDIAFLGAVFTSVTFILLLWFAKKADRYANRFLAMAMAAVALWVAQMLSIDIKLAAHNPFWSRLPLQFSFAIGPLIFFYVLKITQPDYKFKRKDLLHFSPVLLELNAHILEILESVKTGAETYDTLIFRQVNPVLQLLIFTSVIVYLYRCRSLIENFYQQQKFNGGDRYRHELRWLHNILTSFSLLWLLWIPFISIDYFYYNHQLGVQAYYPLCLLLMSMVIWMAARSFLRPEIDAQKTGFPILKPLLPAALRQKSIWLRKVVKENHYYQDPELSLGSLADKLNVHTHELSRIINSALKKSFNDFINEYRIKAAVCKMQDPAYDHITLLGIAFESGFNSQSTFNRIFKQMTGKSPLEYKNSLKKEYPSYNLGSYSQVAPVILNRESHTKWLPDKLNRNLMLKNYFKIAWRNLTRNKSYAAINVTGLAVGIAVCMVIFIIIQFQTSFDNFYSKENSIYRVLT